MEYIRSRVKKEELPTTEDRTTNQHQQPEVVHPKSYMKYQISYIRHQTFYLLLMATTGSSLAAFHAGMIPAIKPTPMLMPMARATIPADRLT